MSVRLININKSIILSDQTEILLKKIIYYNGKVRRSWPYHAHDHYEISFTFHGSNRLRIHGTQYAFGSGDICITAPGTIHGIALNSDTDYMLMDEEDDVWELDLCLPNATPSSASHGILTLPADSSALIVPMGKSTAMIHELLTRIMKRMSHTQEFDDMSHALVVVLLGIIIEQTREPGCTQIRDTSDPYMREILLYISSHFTENISLDTLTEQFAISKSHLIRCFNQNFGISPISHRIEVQISQATDYLTGADSSDTAMTIQQIAEKLGFANITYFNKTFSQRMKMSPGQFREKYAVSRMNIPKR